MLHPMGMKAAAGTRTARDQGGRVMPMVEAVLQRPRVTAGAPRVSLFQIFSPLLTAEGHCCVPWFSHPHREKTIFTS